jgi:hypothetical protein
MGGQGVHDYSFYPANRYYLSLPTRSLPLAALACSLFQDYEKAETKTPGNSF